MIPTAALMLKAPVPGRVKTRLAAAEGIGPEAACAAYRRLVEWQLARIPADWHVVVHHDPADAGSRMRDWLGERPRFRPQPGGTLGDRMRAVMEAHDFSSGPLVYLGGDCPYLGDEVLQRVACSLEAHPVVIVPACDGGYVLLGLRAPFPELFDGIDWSTERVLAQTLERLRAAGREACVFPALEDVDDAGSWQRAENWMAAQSGGFSA